MFDYIGVNCPVCQVPFDSKDDVVVCPDCGAPFHRHCYEKENKCIFESEHFSGKLWERPSTSVSAEIKDKECAYCGVLNSTSASFCNHCGAPLLPPTQEHYSNIRTGSAIQMNGFGRTIPIVAFDPMGGASPADELAPGVTFGEASKLVSQSTGYYMSVFKSLKMFNKGRFCLSAFLFSGVWMLYRKQYKLGTFITVLMFSLFAVYNYIAREISYPIILKIMSEAGIDASQSFYPSADQLQIISAYLVANPYEYLLVALPTLCFIVMLAIMITIGIRGNRMYMKYCIKTITRIKKSTKAEDVSKTIEAHAGVNSPVAFCLALCFFISSFFINFI